MKKTKLLLLFIGQLILFESYGQEKYKKAVVTNQIQIEGNINAAWTMLSNLGNLDKLIPSTIEKSTIVGNGKGSLVTLQLKNGKDTIIEEVVRLNNERRSISYSMISTPLPIKDYCANFKITVIDERNFKVQFKAKFKVQEKNRKSRIEAFNALQIELLNNLKRMMQDEKQ